MAEVVQFKAAVAAIDIGDVVLRIKAPTMAQTHELARLIRGLDFADLASAAKPVFDAARTDGGGGGGFLATLFAELPRLLPALADGIGNVAADALFEAAIAVLDTRHNLGRVIKAAAAEGADDADMPLDLDSGESVEAADGTYLHHPGLRRWLRETLTADAAWRVVTTAVAIGGADMGKAVVGRIAAALRVAAATQPTIPTTTTTTQTPPEQQPTEG